MHYRQFYSHTASERDWEPLITHLREVSKLAGEFATSFDSSEWAELAGAWHDLGKYSNEFQSYLRAGAEQDSHVAELQGKVDHSSAGAQWANERVSKLGKILAYVIAGHHSGLLDYSTEEGRASLNDRLEKKVPKWYENAPKEVLHQNHCPPPLPDLKKHDGSTHAAFKVAFWIRMLFSALVDADYLATEAFMDPARSSCRPENGNLIIKMKAVLDSYVSRKVRDANKTVVNKQRSEILNQCRSHASDVPGFFDLTVPTGGGKTLSSLVFALDHAVEHNLHKVVVAVPFTSIIEQNAQEYRNVFSHMGSGVVLEHHSNLDPNNETDMNRLQSENWDAPLVVTTNVQFFESMFACRTSRCRKLHGLARSVIVLDEVQTLPVDLLKPTLWGLRELVQTYGCTVVLCTATQPALCYREGFEIGLKGVRHIIENPRALYDFMRRTHIKVEDCLTDGALQERMLNHEQALCIVNTRGNAARLAGLLGDVKGHYHLSTRMCGAHRLSAFEEIRNRIDQGMTCRVVSTQLVEAGVDLDFPVVYRARCGLDSLAQAAGRCNREGRRESGEVIFFKAQDRPPRGFLRKSAEWSEELLEKYPDPLSLEAVESYFQLNYWLSKDRWDYHDVLDAVGNNPNSLRFQFAEMSRRYQFIREESSALMIPWRDEGKAAVKQLYHARQLYRDLNRILQRYCVQVRRDELNDLKEKGAVELVHERWVLIDSKHYSEHLGLVFDQTWEVEELII